MKGAGHLRRADESTFCVTSSPCRDRHPGADDQHSVPREGYGHPREQAGPSARHRPVSQGAIRGQDRVRGPRRQRIGADLPIVQQEQNSVLLRRRK